MKKSERRAWTSDTTPKLEAIADGKSKAGVVAHADKRSEGATHQKTFFAGLSLKTRRVKAFVVWFFVLAMCPFELQLAESAQAGDLDKALFEQTIHDYIISHPEVLMESLQQAKADAKVRQAELLKSKLVTFKKAFFEDPLAPVLGNPLGAVTLVEFFDYRCPYCRQVEPWLQTLIKEDRTVRLVQKEWPILGPASVLAAKVAVAAWKQGRHHQFHDALMSRKGNINEVIVIQVADATGIDMEKMKIDIDTPEVASEVERSTEIAKELGLNGTPGFIIGTKVVPGAVDLLTLKSMVDDARHGLN